MSYRPTREDFKAGLLMWWVPTSRTSPRTLRVVKVGRKYAHAEEIAGLRLAHQIVMDSGEVDPASDGLHPDGRVYLPTPSQLHEARRALGMESPR